MSHVSEFPRFLLIQTISVCNASCSFCAYHYIRHELDHGIMARSLFQKIIDECRDQNLERIMPYLMNEPLLDPDLVSKIEYIKQVCSNVPVHFLTNGIKINRRMSEELINSEVEWIGFSIPALDNDTYFRITGRRDFDRIKQNIVEFIQLSLERKDPNFVMISITRDTDFLSMDEMNRAVAFWQSLGVKRIETYEAPISRAGNIPKLRIPEIKEIRGCRSIWTNEMMHIMSNGDVIPCCMDWRREVVLGNVARQSLQEIWTGKAYKEFRQILRGKTDLPDDFICSRCEEAVI